MGSNTLMVLRSQQKLEIILTLIYLNFVWARSAQGWVRYGVKFPHQVLHSASEISVGEMV
jgi:hypothetical protein